MIDEARTNTGDGGYIKLAKEATYAVDPGEGNQTQAIVYNQGGASLKVATETVPRRGIAGLGSMEGVQLRKRNDGGFIFDQELQGQNALLLGLMGGIETVGAGPIFDNFLHSIKELPTFTLTDHWPGNPTEEGQPTPQHMRVPYPGVAINQLALALEGGDPMTADYAMLGATGGVGVAGDVVLDPKSYAPVKPQEITRFDWYGLDLLECFHSFAITTNNNMREDIYPGGLGYRQRPMRGDAGMAVEFTADLYADNNYSDGSTGIYDRFLANGPPGPLILQLDLTDLRLVVYIPELRATGETLSVNDFGTQITTVTGMAEVGLLPFSDAAIFPALGGAGQGTDQAGQLIGFMASNDEAASGL